MVLINSVFVKGCPFVNLRTEAADFWKFVHLFVLFKNRQHAVLLLEIVKLAEIWFFPWLGKRIHFSSRFLNRTADALCLCAHRKRFFMLAFDLYGLHQILVFSSDSVQVWFSIGILLRLLAVFDNSFLFLLQVNFNRNFLIQLCYTSVGDPFCCQEFVNFICDNRKDRKCLLLGCLLRLC